MKDLTVSSELEHTLYMLNCEYGVGTLSNPRLLNATQGRVDQTPYQCRTQTRVFRLLENGKVRFLGHTRIIR